MIRARADTFLAGTAFLSDHCWNDDTLGLARLRQISTILVGLSLAKWWVDSTSLESPKIGWKLRAPFLESPD